MTPYSSEPIPETQRAYVLSKPGGVLHLDSLHPVVLPSILKAGEALVRLTHSGVCGTDLGICRDLYPIRAKENLVCGHEGVGYVVAMGEGCRYGVKDGSIGGGSIGVGSRVGVRYIADTCMCCDVCAKGLEGLCPHLKSHGANIDGTFAQYVVSYVVHLTAIPEALQSPDAAVIMCAGVTVYASLLQCGAKVGDWVVVTGAGGGLGHLAIQYAVAMGLQVIAVDTGTRKRDLCLSLGASHFVDFLQPTLPSPSSSTPNPFLKNPSHVIFEILTHTSGQGAHAALLFGGGSSAYTDAAVYLRRSGYLMVVGIPKNEDGLLQLPILMIAGKGLTIRGVFVASRQQSIEAVDLAARGKIKVIYEMRGLSELEQIYDELAAGKVVGRIVMDVDK